MAVGFYYPTKATATSQWVPSKQPVFPAVEPVDYPEQLAGETAGGTLYVQDKGPKRERFELRFVRIPQADRDLAHAFFNAVNKSFNTFEYEDRNGALHSVRWMNPFEFELVIEGRYSGEIQLRKETA
jgi:hypothetical protein